jgi:hypothetical protein
MSARKKKGDAAAVAGTYTFRKGVLELECGCKFRYYYQDKLIEARMFCDYHLKRLPPI